MLSFWTILTATAPVFIIIAIGFLIQQRGWLGEEVISGVMKLALNLLVPCLILSVIPGNPALERVSSAVWSVGFGFTFVVVGFAVAALFGWMARLRSGHGLRSFALTAGIQNYGYLPIPIIAELFSEKSGPMGLVFVHGIGVEIAMWTVGLVILTGSAGWKSIVNGPFIAVVAALFANYTGLYRLIPLPIGNALETLGQCAIPISILMIGATIGTFFRREIFEDAFRVTLAGVVVRMVVLTFVILVVTRFLPAPPDLKKLMVIQAAMPVAVFPIILTRLFGGSPTVSIQLVAGTSLVSVFTSPLVIAFGLRWLELNG